MTEDWIEELIQVEQLPQNSDFIYVKRLSTFQYEQVA